MHSVDEGNAGNVRGCMFSLMGLHGSCTLLDLHDSRPIPALSKASGCSGHMDSKAERTTPLQIPFRCAPYRVYFPHNA